MVELRSCEKQPEFQYFPLPDTDLADVIICRNERTEEVENFNGLDSSEKTTTIMYVYDSNSFRTTLDKSVIEENLDFYINYEETKPDYPKEISDLKSQLMDTQMALCSIYEAMEALSS